MSRELPERPSLEQLKKHAKLLLHAWDAGDADARARIASLPAFAGLSPATLDAQPIALHDAQSVIAREYGFPSWNALRDEVEARAFTFEQALDEFVRCASGNTPERARRLLARHPGIATGSLQASLVLGDVERATSILRDRPELLHAPGGPQQWPPLLYVCHTCMHRGESSRADQLVALARWLCAHGADPNAEYHWNWHPELPRTALWAAVCDVRHLPLADALLDAGANPTDGVTTHIAAGGGNLDALELLHRYGMLVNGIAGGVPPLAYILLWSTVPSGVRWLIEHGADVNRAWGDAGEAPLHVAARRWDLAIVELLLQHGADVHRPRADGCTPHTIAQLAGNRDVAAALIAHGALDGLSPFQHFLAACARGDRDIANGMLREHPEFRHALDREHHLLLQRPAEAGQTAVLETMLACGFDPNVGDKDGITALHRAAMAGRVDAVRALISGGADVNALDATFAATPLIWAVEGRRQPEAGVNHVGVARVLLEAGAADTWVPPNGSPGPERTLDGLDDLLRAAATGR